MHDELTDFGVRVSDQSFIVMVCGGEFTVSHKVFSINQGECLIACMLVALDRTHTIFAVFRDFSCCFLMTRLSMPVDCEVFGGLAGRVAFRLDFMW